MSRTGVEGLTPRDSLRTACLRMPCGSACAIRHPGECDRAMGEHDSLAGCGHRELVHRAVHAIVRPRAVLRGHPVIVGRLGLEAGDEHAECRLRMTPIDPDGELRRLAVLRQNLARASLDDVPARRTGSKRGRLLIPEPREDRAPSGCQGCRSIRESRGPEDGQKEETNDGRAKGKTGRC